VVARNLCLGRGLEACKLKRAVAYGAPMQGGALAWRYRGRVDQPTSHAADKAMGRVSAARYLCDRDLPARRRSYDLASACRIRSGERTSGSNRADRWAWGREPATPDVPARGDRAGRPNLCESPQS